MPWHVSYNSKVVNRKFAFNVIPHIDIFIECVEKVASLQNFSIFDRAGLARFDEMRGY